MHQRGKDFIMNTYILCTLLLESQRLLTLSFYMPDFSLQSSLHLQPCCETPRKQPPPAFWIFIYRSNLPASTPMSTYNLQDSDATVQSLLCDSVQSLSVSSTLPNSAASSLPATPRRRKKYYVVSVSKCVGVFDKWFIFSFNPALFRFLSFEQAVCSKPHVWRDWRLPEILFNTHRGVERLPGHQSEGSRPDYQRPQRWDILWTP